MDMFQVLLLCIMFYFSSFFIFQVLLLLIMFYFFLSFYVFDSIVTFGMYIF